MARFKNLSIFCWKEFQVRNLIAHFCIMLRNRKKHGSASVAQSTFVVKQPNAYTIEDVVKLVRISFLAIVAKIDMVMDKYAKKRNEFVLRSIFPLRQYCTN